MTVRILHGDALAVLKTLPEASVHMAVSSPPYWSLRDYGVPPTVWGGAASCDHEWGDEERSIQANSVPGPNTGGKNDGYRNTTKSAGQFCAKCDAWLGCLGLEPTPGLYIEHVAMVFDEVFRVLRPDGTLWLNLGDCYAGGGPWWESHKAAPGVKPKDLVGIPWMAAFALRARGWYLRSDIIWSKRNPMPESIRDRPTKAHEYVFLLSKSEDYYFDAHAIRETDGGRDSGNKRRFVAKQGERSRLNTHLGSSVPWQSGGGRNRRSVWHLSTQPYPGAHFATFPQKLVEPCILAGTSEHGCCSICGAPFDRIVERRAPIDDQKRIAGADAHGEYRGKATKAYDGTGAQDPSAVKARILDGMRERVTVGWKPTCDHSLRHVDPCVVLDPFAGSGTAGLVAQQLGRSFIGIELNPDYVAMAERRIAPAEVSA